MVKPQPVCAILPIIFLHFVCVAELAELPALNAFDDQTSISGVSSGGFMAAQFHIAYSKSLIGAGVIAGGPWSCASSDPLVMPALSAPGRCMNPCKGNFFDCPASLFPDSDFLARLAKKHEKLGEVDLLENIKDDNVYIFSGSHDQVVLTAVVDTTAEFYFKLGLTESQIKYDNLVPAGHAFITAEPEDTECSQTKPPFINNCDLPQAQQVLNHIYGELTAPADELSGELVEFRQSDYFDGPHVSMDESAYVYIPQSCQLESCKIHVAMHGCQQGASEVGTVFIEKSGFLEVADTNKVIVLFPQVKSLPSLNPDGCWDYWGYTNDNMPPYHYALKHAPQMAAIKAMLDRLSSR